MEPSLSLLQQGACNEDLQGTGSSYDPPCLCIVPCHASEHGMVPDRCKHCHPGLAAEDSRLDIPGFLAYPPHCRSERHSHLHRESLTSKESDDIAIPQTTAPTRLLA